MNRYFDLSRAEKIALSNDQFELAVKIEGIHRSIKPPITLDDALTQIGWHGFTLPTDATVVFEVVKTAQYSGIESTGVAYLKRERAEAALAGMVSIADEGYPKKTKLRDAEFSIREVRLGISDSKGWNAKIDAFEQDNADFNKLADECRADWQTILNEEYQRKVNLQKRAEYLRLANNDETVARAFWAKTERTEFPEAEVSVA